MMGNSAYIQILDYQVLIKSNRIIINYHIEYNYDKLFIN